MTDDACKLLVRIGTASQVIDDITGAFPGVLDDDKDPRRDHPPTPHRAACTARPSRPATRRPRSARRDPPLDREEALRLRAALWNSDVAALARWPCQRLLADIDNHLAELRLGTAATTYLHDLVERRLRNKIDLLQRHSTAAPGAG